MAIICLYRKARQAKISLTWVSYSVTLAESNALEVYIAALVVSARGVSGATIPVDGRRRNPAGPGDSESEGGQMLHRSRLLPPRFEGRPQRRRDLDSRSQLRAPMRRSSEPGDPGADGGRAGRPVV